jgi:hypothetical protein
MKHNPNFCCACGNHIKKEEWIKLSDTISHYVDPEDEWGEDVQLKVQLHMCPNCKCVQGE